METSNHEIVLKPESLIGYIQSQFNLFYPFLKIEFLKNNSISSEKIIRLNSEYCIKNVSEFSFTQELNVNKNRTVAQIASDCMLKLGLSIQVLRKSGNVWNIISLTDNWTLENQNNAGQFISSEMTSVPPSVTPDAKTQDQKIQKPVLKY